MPDEYDALIDSLGSPAKKARPPLDYRALYQEVGKKHGVDPDLLYNQAKQESVNFNPLYVYGPGKSPKGAAGLSQFMPETAKQYGLYVGKGRDDRFNPRLAADAQARMMKDLIAKHGDATLALAAYNSGHNKTSAQARRSAQRIPETRGYVQKIAPKGDKYDQLLDGIGESQGAPPQADPYDALLDSLDTPTPKTTKRVSPFARVKAGVKGVSTPTERPAQGMGDLRRIDDPEASRIIRQQKQVAAEPNRRANARLFDPKLNDAEEAARRASEERLSEIEQAKHTAQYKRDKPEIDRLAKTYREAIRGGNLGGVKWGSETVAKGIAPLVEKIAGIGSVAAAGGSPGAQIGVDKLRIHAQALQQAAVEEGADRNQASQFVQDVAGGFIGSAPELAAMSAGVPAPLAFGAGSGLHAAGRGEPVVPATAHGALTGAAFEIPVAGQGIKHALKRAGAVGATTTGIDLAAGATPREALTAGATNAALVGLPEAVRGRKVPSVPERPETVSAQLDAVKEGTRPTVLIAPGTQRPSLPRGMRAEKTSEGVFYYDPRQVSPDIIRQKVADGTFGELLGHVEPKSETTTEAVVARTPEGTEIQSSAVSPENVGKQAEVMAAQYPEAKIETGGPEVAAEVLAERAAPQRFQHLQFGEVEVLADQSGARPGKIRVAEVADPTKQHFLKRASMLGRGNERMIPIKESPVEVPVEPAASPELQSETVAPARVAVSPTKPVELATKAGENVVKEAEPIRAEKTVRTSVAEGSAESAPNKPITTSAVPSGMRKERATPKTLEKAELEGGTDRLYDPETNEGQLKVADETIKKHGLDASIEIARRSAPSGEKTALGISLLRELQNAGKHDQAVDVASDLARQLTQSGQAIQAVSIVSRLSPERVLATAAKIVQKKNPNAKLRPDQAQAITEHATKLEDAIARIATLEARIEQIKLKPKVGIRKPKLETLQDRLLKAEQEARVRLAERAAMMKVGGPERGASGIPADIADYAIIGAVKLTRKGVTFAQWSGEMTKEFGDAIKPKLREIYRAAYSTLGNERKRMREETEARLSRKELEGPVRPEDMDKLIEQRRQAQRDARASRYSLAKTFNYLERGRTGQVLDVAADVANIPRTLMSSVDLSAPLRQGGFFSFTETRASAKAAKDMIRAVSERGYDKVLEEIKDHPDHSLAKRSGVEFTEVGRNDLTLSHTEEAFLSKTAGNLPLVKQSQQAYVAFLDAQRMQVFSRFASELRAQGKTLDTHPEAFKAIGRFVNIGTGRGTLGRKGNQMAPFLNAIGFSPRFLASRFQLLNAMANPVAWARMPEGARQIIMRKNIRFVATVGTVLGLAAAAGAKVGTDPDDADFLTIRVGNTRYDVLSGLQQPLRFLLRLGTAIKADITKDETYAGENKLNLITRFARSKEAPAFSFVHDYVAGEDYMGRKFDLTSKSLDNPVASRVIPMLIKDTVKAMQEEGLLGTIKTTPAIFGLGVQTYPERPDMPRSHAEKLARKFVRARMPDNARTAEQVDLDRTKADLRAKSRRGEDVTRELEALGAKITDKQAKNILNARNKTRLQEDVNRLGALDAIIVWSVMTPGQREATRSLLEHKATLIDNLPEEQQAAVRQRYADAGIEARSKQKKSGFKSAFSKGLGVQKQVSPF